MIRISTVVQGVIATAFIWVAVAMVRVVGGPEAGMLDFALFAGLGATIALWLVWAFVGMDQAKSQAERGKAKRSGGEEDARLSLLLLAMLDEDQRASLKQRLRGELSADGEAIALDDLLEDRRAR